MITVNKAAERGNTNWGWLDSYHIFSFADYYNPKQMGFRTLRVINDDKVAAAEGFGTHPHRDMEIISYVVDGALEHKDSMGNGSVIKAGDVQRMSAGTGVTHSEFNSSKTEEVHFLQVWIMPAEKNVKPAYEQKHFTEEQKLNRLTLVVSGDGRHGSLQINQDANLYASIFSAGEKLTHLLPAGRHGFIQVVSGEITLNGTILGAGDSAAIEDEQQLSLAATRKAEFLLFDLN